MSAAEAGPGRRRPVRRVIGWLLLLLPLAGAVAVTVLRLWQPSWGTAVRLVSFTPFALPVYAAVLLVALLRLVLVRSRARRVTVVLALIALVGGGLHLWWLSPQFTGSRPEPAPAAEPVRAMTLNLLRGGADPAEVVDEVVAGDVEVLALQEVTPAALAGLEAAGLDQVLPYRVGAPAPGVEGTMLLSATPLSAEQRLDTRFGSWAAETTLERAAGSTTLRIWAVHAYPPIGSAARWRRDLAALTAEVDAAGGAGAAPDLVLGDFNATSDHRDLQRLLGGSLVDVAERVNAGWRPTWPADGEVRYAGVPMPPLVAIDHVLVGPALAAVAAERVSVAGTDHAGLLATVASR